VGAEFSAFLADCQSRFSQSCEDLLNPIDFPTGSDTLADACEAANYSLSVGGKRIRPILCFCAALAVGVDEQAPSLNYLAAALEMLHTYSLIHDDLPAMDDDDLRRGKPSVHVAFDEARAILAGDGLQARAFELFADAPDITSEQKIAIIKTAAAAVGHAGMVGGQFIDIQATNQDISLDTLETMHSLKTGALIRASLLIGAISGNANQAELDALDGYGKNIGLAFQIVDDILDVTGDTESLGKTAGKDNAAHKSTYVSLLGIDGAKQEAQHYLEAALSSISALGDRAGKLRALAQYIVSRNL